jgi:two-component system response regulator FixJ
LFGSDGLAERAFGDPESFLEYVKTQSVWVVVLDIWMEHMTGLEVQARVAKVSPHTRVIIMTGREEPEAEQTALKLGAIAFFTKPFDDEAFLVAVRGALFSP